MSSPSSKETGGESHRKYLQSLPSEERMLITLREELYGGSWNRMLEDLRDRLTGRPYIYKLVNKIEEDIKRIEKMKEYEEAHGINLAQYHP